MAGRYPRRPARPATRRSRRGCRPRRRRALARCVRRRTRDRISAPGADDVGPAGVQPGQREPLGDGHRRRAGRRARARRRPRARPGRRRPVVRREAEHPGADRGHGAGDADDRGRVADRHRARVEVRVDVGDAGRDLVGGRRVGAQVPLVQAHRADVHRDRGDVGPVAAEPRTSSVEPPPMSTTSTGSAGACRRLRTAPSKASAASSSPETTSGSTPSRCADPGDEDLGVLRVPAGRGGAEPDPVDVVRGDQGGVLVDGREGPLQRLVGEPAGRVDALAEPDHPHLAHARPRAAAPISSLMVLVPQSIARG